MTRTRCLPEPDSVKPVWPHQRERGPLPNPTKSRSTRTSRRAVNCASCTLLTLPRELRDEIYKYLIPTFTTINFATPTWSDNAAGRFFDVKYDMSPYSLAILAVCKQTRTETSALLYGTNRFEFSIGIRPPVWYWRMGTPSPYNTVRALPQSGIKRITACTVRMGIPVEPNTIAGRQAMSLVGGWMNELSQLFKQGGELLDLKIELGNLRNRRAVPFRTLLAPLEGLRGLKSVDILGNNLTEAYGAKLKKIMKSDRIDVRKRKPEMDKEGNAEPPKKKSKKTK